MNTTKGRFKDKQEKPNYVSVSETLPESYISYRNPSVSWHLQVAPDFLMVKPTLAAHSNTSRACLCVGCPATTKHQWSTCAGPTSLVFTTTTLTCRVRTTSASLFVSHRYKYELYTASELVALFPTSNIYAKLYANIILSKSGIDLLFSLSRQRSRNLTRFPPS